MFQPLFFLKVSVAVSVELWYMFVLQGGDHMNKLLKDLYDCFYTPPELAATKLAFLQPNYTECTYVIAKFTL